MTNEAAERLRDVLYERHREKVSPPFLSRLLDEALAAERRATVDRIRAATDSGMFLADILAILDAEAER
jgi:hypothetical protein